MGPKFGDKDIQDESGVPQEPSDPILDSTQVTAGDLILLDPTEVQDEDIFERIMRRLPSYQAELQERDAYLVVVLAESYDSAVREELRHLLVTLGRPDAARVVRQHLKVAEIPFAEHELRESKALSDRQRAEPMRTLAELIRLVGDARDRLGPAGGFAGWLDAALGVLDKLADKVAAHVKTLRGGSQRALLLATAMLADAPADQVDLAATALAGTAALPDERPPLERDDLAQRLEEIKATVDRNGCVRFETFGYEQAVRQHFWDNFAILRDDFRNWAREVAVSPDIGASERDRFVACFADQALRTGRPDDIRVLVSRWIELTDARDRSLPAAALALERGLGDQRHGALYRRLIYDWSRDRAVAKDTAYLAIAMCADVISSTHPSEAVVRLHHFVRRQLGEVRAAATEALLHLVRQDRREFRRLLDRVVTGLIEDRWSAEDFPLFLVLAKPRELAGSGSAPLRVDKFVRQRLVDAWQDVLFKRPSVDWTDLARDWLDAIETNPLDGLWRDILIEACARPGPGAGRLYVVVRDWTREPGADQRARKAIGLELTYRMTPAHGMAPGDPSPHQSEEPIQ